MKRLIFSTAICAAFFGTACNEQQSGEARDGDTLPSVVVPPPHDTSAVKTTPPINDSNVVNPDSQGTAR